MGRLSESLVKQLVELYQYLNTFFLMIPLLLHDVIPGSDIKPCNEMDKPLLVYIFSNIM